MTFLNSANLVKQLNGPEHEPLLVQFLITRLTDKAIAGLPSNITAFDELIENVRTRCQKKLDQNSIIAKLKAIRTQDTKSVCNQVELLTKKGLLGT